MSKKHENEPFLTRCLLSSLSCLFDKLEVFLIGHALYSTLLRVAHNAVLLFFYTRNVLREGEEASLQVLLLLRLHVVITGRKVLETKRQKLKLIL